MRWNWIPRWLITVLIVIVIVILAAVIIAALGGFDWVVDIGHFHLNIGVSKS